MQRILIDLTDIEQWSGNHGGIQRVVYGIAKNFYLNQDSIKQDVSFISYSDANKFFVYSSFKPVYDLVEKIVSETTVDDANPEPVASGNNYVKKSIVSKVRSSLPTKMTKRLNKQTSIDTEENELEAVIFNKTDIVLMLGKPWDNLDIQRTLTKEKAQSHFTLVQVVYDMIISLYPHLQNPVLINSYNEHMRSVAEQSDLLLAISKTTASDLKKFCSIQKIKPPKVRVFRIGDDIADPKQTTEKPDERIKKQFIACVGTVEIRKNHTLLYYAYKLAAERNIELPQLLIVGGQGWLTGDIQYIINSDPDVKDKILMLHTINDSGLAWIYKNCLFTVYPSMYEGWGLPIAESLAFGKLCLSSNYSSMPEIAGSLIDYFSPYSPEECIDKIRLYMDSSRRTEKENEIKEKYIPFTWRQTFDELLACLDSDIV